MTRKVIFLTAALALTGGMPALAQPAAERLHPRAISLLGLVGCLGLITFVDREVVLVALPVVLVGLIYKFLRDRLLGDRAS